METLIRTQSSFSESEYDLKLDHEYKLPLTKINSTIYIGSIDESRKVDLFKKNQIDCILNLTQTNLVLNRSGNRIDCQNCPLSLNSFSSLMKTLPRCLEQIENSISNGHKIAILCQDGISKTLTVVSAYYILKYNKPYTDIRQQFELLIPESMIHLNIEYENYLEKLTNLIQQTKTSIPRTKSQIQTIEI